MQSADTQTFTIIIDDDAAAYLEQAGIRDANHYINALLHTEKERRRQAGKDPLPPGKEDLDALLSSTPDTSGPRSGL